MEQQGPCCPAQEPRGLGLNQGKLGNSEDGSLAQKEHRTPQRGSGGTLPIMGWLLGRKQARHGGRAWRVAGRARVPGSAHRPTSLSSGLNPLWGPSGERGEQTQQAGCLSTGQDTWGPGPQALPTLGHTRCPRPRANADPKQGRQGDPAWRPDATLQGQGELCPAPE